VRLAPFTLPLLLADTLAGVAQLGVDALGQPPRADFPPWSNCTTPMPDVAQAPLATGSREKWLYFSYTLAMNGDLLEPVNWTWGLSLIALTIAIHATGVVVLALVGLRIQVRIANRRLGLRYVIPIVIGLVAAAGLLLAVLHGIEAAIWAAAYLWLGGCDVHARRLGADAAKALADDGRAGGR
jgi:hypothetical protein